jgi:hypothetical protein
MNVVKMRPTEVLLWSRQSACLQRCHASSKGCQVASEFCLNSLFTERHHTCTFSCPDIGTRYQAGGIRCLLPDSYSLTSRGWLWCYCQITSAGWLIRLYQTLGSTKFLNLSIINCKTQKLTETMSHTKSTSRSFTFSEDIGEVSAKLPLKSLPVVRYPGERLSFFRENETTNIMHWQLQGNPFRKQVSRIILG